jgi:hypothetical protein
LKPENKRKSKGTIKNLWIEKRRERKREKEKLFFFQSFNNSRLKKVIPMFLLKSYNSVSEEKEPGPKI